MQKIIFDLDQTLISNVDFNVPVRHAFEDIKYSYTEQDVEAIQKAINGYEVIASKYDKSTIMNYFRLYLNSYLPDTFIDYFIDELALAIPEKLEDGVVDTLDYLASNYKLYVLTNWFRKSQYERLRNVGIDKYFTEVYGGETFKKPRKEAYLQVCGDTNLGECLMVGDSFQYDYDGAIRAGLNAVLLDKDNHYKTIPYGIDKIENIKTLKKML